MICQQKISKLKITNKPTVEDFKNIKVSLWLTLYLLLSTSVVNLLNAQNRIIERKAVKEFEILSRKANNEKPLNYKRSELMEMMSSQVKIKDNSRKLKYIRSGIHVRKVGRIVSFEDTSNLHVVTNAFLSIYSDNGELIKSLGQIATLPYVAAVTENGATVIAGNKGNVAGKPEIYFTKYDKNGNKIWQKPLQNVDPKKIYVSKDENYLALIVFDSNSAKREIHFYDKIGTLLFTIKNRDAITIEFLTQRRVIICSATNWYLYDLSKGNDVSLSGTLKGLPIGENPISSCSGIFTIVTESNPGIRIQAFNSLNGDLINENVFEGNPVWPAFRLVEISSTCAIKLLTSKEVIMLKSKL